MIRDIHNNNNNNNFIAFCHRTFLEPTAISTAQNSVSDCSTFRIMCDVPSTAVFCSESIECFHGMAFRTFLEPFVAIPVVQVITGIITHILFHILRISLQNSCILAAFLRPFA